MKWNWGKTGAVFYILWGVMHVMLGFMMLSKFRARDASGMLAMVATGPQAGDPSAALPAVAVGLLRQHAWNLIVFGAVSTGVAVRMNWRNDRAGYWFNLGLVSLADLGFIFMILLPGYMAASGAALVGPLLWLAAGVSSTLGRLRPT